MNARTLPPVLMADDDPDDCTLAAEAFKMAKLANELRCLSDGEKLIEYLHRCVRGHEANCFPALILLDLNMPRMDGRETLQALKADPTTSAIPVVVWTTSHSEDDIKRARAAGCDEYVIKPASFVEMVRLMRAIADRWLPASTEISGKTVR